jgi:hypothetical protein
MSAHNKKTAAPGFKTWKPRREFRAYLIHSLKRAGAQLPPEPTYVELREALDQVLARLP